MKQQEAMAVSDIPDQKLQENCRSFVSPGPEASSICEAK
jgi:hypothetical protein